MVVHCTEPVYILLSGDKPQDWRACINLFRKLSFLEELVIFDINNANVATIQKLEPYINSPEFYPANMAKVSSAIGTLCQ